MVGGLGDVHPDVTNVVKEVGCLRYTTEVLDLAKQGYTAAQIQQAVVAAGVPVEDDPATSATPGESFVINACGTPAEVLAGAGVK